MEVISKHNLLAGPLEASLEEIFDPTTLEKT
jgi:hypothetical protein